MKIRIALLISLFGLLVTGSVFAAGYAWRDHAAPYNFLFGNHIDTHQQSKVLRNGQLNGFLYIVYTGEEMDGVPAAMHGDCTMQPEACAVGWMLQGVPVQATLLDKPEGDHPQWCINKQDMPGKEDTLTFIGWVRQNMQAIYKLAKCTMATYLS